MKTTYKKICAFTLNVAFAAGAMTFVSCNDMLDTVPQGQFTSEQLDDNSVEGLVASAYAGLEAHFYGNNEAFAGPSTNWIFDVRSDDALKGGGGTGMEENIHLLEVSEITSDNVSCLNKWQNNFYAISRVHNAMKAIASASNIGNAAQLQAELKTLRAWYYFDLIRIFKRIPYFTENDDPNTASNDQYTREEIFEFIKNDLKDAIAVLPQEKSTAGRITKTTAAAILAKVCAFTSSWADVETYADMVINSGQYELYDNYLDMSKIEFNNRKESIFALQCSTANDNAHINWSNLLNASMGPAYNGDDFFYGSQDLANAFRTNPNNGLPYLDGSYNSENVDENYAGTVDPRLDFTLARIGVPFRGQTYTESWIRAREIYGQFSGKKCMIDPTSPEMVSGWPWGASALNFCFIRYADIILLKAEALIEQNKDLPAARDLINQIRAKAQRSIDGRYTPVDLNPSKTDYYIELYPTTGEEATLTWTQNYARMALRMERRLELAMEGNRWFDLVRWGDDYLMTTMNKFMENESKVRSYYSGRSVTANEIFLPVPLAEIDNSNGLYKQY